MTTADLKLDQPSDIFDLSDEQIENMSTAPVFEAPTKTPEEIAAEEAAAREAAAAEQARLDQEEADRLAAEQATNKEETEEEKAARLAQEAEEASKNDPNGGKVAANADDNAESKVDANGKPLDSNDGNSEQKAASKAAATTTEATVDYEAEYKKLLAPFKANGKTIELRNADEAIQLMQMGANYTRKMQDIQPHRKVLMMLEQNGLLDEGKLSYLIDIDKKNPEAIQKLLKDSNIDPLTLDVEKDSTYLPGNHAVSDEHVAFQSALDDLVSTQSGVETVQTINTTWDQASKDVLWKDPSLLRVFDEQRSNGIYDRITTEITRLTVLGQIPAGTPFLQAYKAVGDAMQSEGKFADIVKPSVAQTTTKQPIAVAAPKPVTKVANSDTANAASGNRAAAVKAKPVVNYLDMDDDAFLKQMNNRV
ncbi:putative tape measure protein [Burkholderia phage vB_BpP_HN05]